MKKLTIDLHDYIEGGSVYKRTAVRGIIQKDKKYLLIYSKYGDHKFPGGGLKQGESLEDTLLCEVQEETGYIVKKESISTLLSSFFSIKFKIFFSNCVKLN